MRYCLIDVKHWIIISANFLPYLIYFYGKVFESFHLKIKIQMKNKKLYMSECDYVYDLQEEYIFYARAAYFLNEFLWIILVPIFKTLYCFPKNLAFTILKSLESIFKKRPEITSGTAWCSAKCFASPWYSKLPYIIMRRAPAKNINLNAL